MYDLSFTMPDVSAPDGWMEFWFDDVDTLDDAVAEISSPRDGVRRVIAEDSILRARDKSGKLVAVGLNLEAGISYATKAYANPLLIATSSPMHHFFMGVALQKHCGYKSTKNLIEYWNNTTSAAELVYLASGAGPSRELVDIVIALLAKAIERGSLADKFLQRIIAAYDTMDDGQSARRVANASIWAVADDIRILRNKSTEMLSVEKMAHMTIHSLGRVSIDQATLFKALRYAEQSVGDRGKGDILTGQAMLAHEAREMLNVLDVVERTFMYAATLHAQMRG